MSSINLIGMKLYTELPRSSSLPIATGGIFLLPIYGKGTRFQRPSLKGIYYYSVSLNQSIVAATAVLRTVSSPLNTPNVWSPPSIQKISFFSEEVRAP